ncbi:hypothetical protein A2U01_0102231, partial [Trifolium medium]|nr:hypothetical protein [Trifolium medium]
PIPFTSRVSTILYAEIGRVCWDIVLGLDGSAGLEALLFPFVVAICLSLLEEYSSSRGGAFEGL